MATVTIEIPVSVQDNTGSSLTGITTKLNSLATAAEKVSRLMVGGGSKKTGFEKSMESLNRAISKPHAVELTVHDNATPTINVVKDAVSGMSNMDATVDISGTDNASGVMANVGDHVATIDGSTANVEAFGEDNASDVMADVSDSVAETDGETANVEAYGEDNASDIMADVQDSVSQTDGSTANVEAYGEDNASDVMADVQDAVAETDGSTANTEVFAEDNATDVISGVEDALSALDGSSATVTIEAADNSGAGSQGGFSMPSVNLPSAGSGSIPGLASAGAGFAAAKNGLLGAAGFAGLSLGIGSAVSSFKDFEYGMSEVKAISGATDEEFQRLTAAAKQTGATTKFTATESAEALKYMAMAGWEPDEMEAGLSGIVNLAAASGESIGTASDIVTDALTAFGMQASDSDHFADVLAKASASANTNVSEMGEAFKYVGASAGAMGYSIEDTAVAIGLMSNAGVHASMAGTALRRSILGLSAPSDKAKAAMDKYGISMENENGKAKSLLEVMTNLREGLGGIESETEQMAVAKDLFGQQAATGMLAIINASEEDWNDMIEAMSDVEGTAAEMSGIMLDNLQGSLTLLGSAFEGVQDTLGERFSPYIRDLADNLTKEMPKVSAAINNTFDSIEAAFEENGLEGVAEEIGNIVADIATSIGTHGEEAIEAASAFMASLFQSIGEETNAEKISSAAASIVTSFGTSFASLSGDFSTAALSLLSGFTQALVDNEAGTKIVEAVTNSLSDVGSWFDEDGESFSTAAGGLIDQLTSGIESNSDKIGDAAAKIVTGIGTSFAENTGDFTTAALSLVDGFVSGLGENEAGTKIADAITESLSDVGNWFGENGGDFGAAAGELISQLVTGISSNSGSIIGAGIQIVSGLAQGLAQGIGVLVGQAPTIILDLIGGILQNIPMLFQAGVELINALKEGLISAGEGLGDFLNDMLTIDPIELNSEINYDNPGTEIMGNIQGSMQDAGSAFSSLDSDAQGFFASLASGEMTVSALNEAIQGMDPSSLEFLAANAALQTFIDEVNSLHEQGVGVQDTAEETSSAIEETGEAAKTGADMVESAMERVTEASNADIDNTGIEGTVDTLNEMAEQAAETGDTLENALDIDLADSLGGLTGDTLSTLLNSEDMAATAEEINSAMQTVAEGLGESASQMDTAISESMSSMSESLSTAQEAFTNMQTAADTAMSGIKTGMSEMANEVQSALSTMGIQIGDTGSVQSALHEAIQSSGSRVEEVTAEGMTIKLGNVEIDSASAAQQIAEALGTTVEELASSAGTTEAEIEAEGKITISSAYYDTSSLESATEEEPDVGEQSATASLKVEFSEVEVDTDSIVSEVESQVTSAFSGQTFPAESNVEVTLSQTNNAAQIYSECGSQIDGTFAGGFSTTATVSVTLSWNITNPTASIDVSTSGGTATATIASASMANGGFLDEASLILAGEAGPEFVIPVGANKRNRGMELWMEAGNALGVPGFADGGIVGGIPVESSSDGNGYSWKSGDFSPETSSGSSEGSKEGPVIQVTMSPSFNLNEVNENNVLAMIRNHMDEFTNEFCEQLSEMLAESYENRPAV